MIEGSAGAGKTKLVDASTELATGLGFRVGRGAVEPYVAGPTELEALLDALFEGPTPLADRRALGDSHASPEFLFWLVQDLQSVIEEAALKSPLLICLDDLHWAGASCAVALRQLGPRLATLPVAWVLAYRPNQGVAPIQQTRSELIDGGADHIKIGPLNRDAVALVVADVLGAQPDEDLLKRTERMKGNPFLLVEFLRDSKRIRSSSTTLAAPSSSRTIDPDDSAKGSGGALLVSHRSRPGSRPLHRVLDAALRSTISPR